MAVIFLRADVFNDGVRERNIEETRLHEQVSYIRTSTTAFRQQSHYHHYFLSFFPLQIKVTQLPLYSRVYRQIKGVSNKTNLVEGKNNMRAIRHL